MVLETAKLNIIPLTKEQFSLLLNGIEYLEKALDLVPSGEALDIHTQEAMSGLYKESLSHPNSYHWYTSWQIILKPEHKIIGSACFIKDPDDEGKVEVGYGINETYRGNGYMTEAIICMCQWAFCQEGIRMIIAETDVDNYASQRVLEKSGMAKYKQNDSSIWWRMSKH